MSWKRLFSRALAAAPGRLHAAAHSHHLWPDAAFEGHDEAARDAARLADRKWKRVFGEILPAARAEVVSELKLPSPDTVAFAPNTHDFLVRLRSCFGYDRPLRVLTTDGEFHAFTRQLARWEEAGQAKATRVPVEPFATFPERLLEAAGAGGFDWAFLSHAFYNSGRVIPDLASLVGALADRADWLIVDGYHGFMTIETDFAPLAERVFYVAGGYKYAMSGEGVGLLHAPPGFGPRPVDTGWFAAFEALEAFQGGGVAYPETASRFLGATFDPTGVYRFLGVRRMLAAEDLDTASISAHVAALQDRFCAAVAAGEAGRLAEALLLAPPPPSGPRARFTAWRHPDAPAWKRRLDAADVITDLRGDVLRIGLALYHDAEDVDRLAAACRSACL
jgi:selenocysteine lyase/cysteine desulfurase